MDREDGRNIEVHAQCPIYRTLPFALEPDLDYKDKGPTIGPTQPLQDASRRASDGWESPHFQAVCVAQCWSGKVVFTRPVHQPSSPSPGRSAGCDARVPRRQHPGLTHTVRHLRLEKLLRDLFESKSTDAKHFLVTVKISGDSAWIDRGKNLAIQLGFFIVQFLYYKRSSPCRIGTIYM